MKTSAEGGRFWRHAIHIEIAEVENTQKLNDSSEDSIRWVTTAQMSSIIQQPLQSSLELRMAWSLLCSEALESV